MKEKIYKRYMVFESFGYEAQPGVGDRERDFGSKSDALKHAKKSRFDDVSVFDRIDGKIIYGNGRFQDG